MYNVMSPKAEEFISHEEVLESLAYAEKNKNNRELIDGILTKARERKGLSHREAAVFWTVSWKIKIRKSMRLRNRLRRISTETGLLCLRRCISQITA